MEKEIFLKLQMIRTLLFKYTETSVANDRLESLIEACQISDEINSIIKDNQKDCFEMLQISKEFNDD